MIHPIPRFVCLSLALTSTAVAQLQEPGELLPITVPYNSGLTPSTASTESDLTETRPGAALVPLATYQAQNPPEESTWKGSFALGMSVTMGNTRRRAANANFDAERRDGKHRTTLKAAWIYAQQLDTDPTTTTGRYEIQQRRTQGSIKQDYFLGDKDFAFVGADAGGDYARNLELLAIITAGYGFQVIDEKNLAFSVEVGVGHYTERARVTPPTGVRETDYIAAKVSSNLDWQINEQWQLLNTITYIPSLEIDDEFYGQSDTRLRTKLSENMFAQLQWILDYDNTPLADVNGNPNNRMDHQVFLTVGWTF